MRICWVLLVFFLIQCAKGKEDLIRTEIVYKIDTVYIELNEDEYERPWDLACGDGNQLEMNCCSRRQFEIADSILEMRYKAILIDLDEDIEKLEMNKSLPRFDESELLNYRVQKRHLIQMQKYFIAMRLEVQNFARLYYEGGTMLPMMFNLYSIQLTEGQIEILKTLSDGPKG